MPRIRQFLWFHPFEHRFIYTLPVPYRNWTGYLPPARPEHLLRWDTTCGQTVPTTTPVGPPQARTGCSPVPRFPIQLIERTDELPRTHPIRGRARGLRIDPGCRGSPDSPRGCPWVCPPDCLPHLDPTVPQAPRAGPACLTAQTDSGQGRPYTDLVRHFDLRTACCRFHTFTDCTCGTPRWRTPPGHLPGSGGLPACPDHYPPPPVLITRSDHSACLLRYIHSGYDPATTHARGYRAFTRTLSVPYRY